MKILFLTRELNGVMGGLERQIMMISHHLARQNLEITIVSLEKAPGKPFFSDFTEGINLRSIIAGDPSQPANFRTRFSRQLKFQKILRETNPDIIVTFMIGSLIFAKPLAFINQIPIILSERNSPDIYQLTSAKRFKWLYFLIMSFAHKITVQFPSYMNKYPSFLRRKIVCIPNQVPQVTGKMGYSKNNEIVFGYAGRFSFQKRIDLLIESFSKLNQDFPDTRLLIFGYGEQQKHLEGIVSQLKLFSSVEFREEQSEIEEAFDEIDIFCLFSLWEGFPNVLAEALAYGIPSVGFTSCDGVNDLIQDGINGWKIPFEDSIESGYQLLTRAYLGFKKEEVSKESCQASVSMYSSASIYSSWNDLLRVVSKP
jgi:glycosyltransferase involved in cell wall biosynthesis